MKAPENWIDMSEHSTWPEWIYIGVVVALLVYVGAEAWNIERISKARCTIQV